MAFVSGVEAWPISMSVKVKRHGQGLYEKSFREEDVANVFTGQF